MIFGSRQWTIFAQYYLVVRVPTETPYVCCQSLYYHCSISFCMGVHLHVVVCSFLFFLPPLSLLFFKLFVSFNMNPKYLMDFRWT